MRKYLPLTMLAIIAIQNCFAQMAIQNKEIYSQFIFQIELGESNEGVSSGVGFVIGYGNGNTYFLTAKHVVKGEAIVKLRGLNGQELKGKVVKSNASYDVSLIQYEGIIGKENAKYNYVDNLQMNDEVSFICANRNGVTLPSAKPGLVIDITGEEIRCKMNDVKGGDSGSPLFCEFGITGMIIENGRIIRSLNISLLKLISEQWSDEFDFNWMLKPGQVQREKLEAPTSLKEKADVNLPIIDVAIDGVCKGKAPELMDNDLTSSWICTSLGLSTIWVNLGNEALVKELRIFYPDNNGLELPNGSLYTFHSGKQAIDFSLKKILSHSEAVDGGRWYIYKLKKYYPASLLLISFSLVSGADTKMGFNEIKVIGITP